MMTLLLAVLLAVAGAAPWPDLTLPSQTDPAPADAAVVVGIDRHFVVSDVPGATRNAEDWYRYLTSTRGIPPSRVALLRDGEATRERVLAAVRDAAHQAGSAGRVWFIFIGHGVPTADGRDAALVGVDAQSTPDALYPRSVLRSEVLHALRTRDAVLVLDTCFSGRSTAGALLPGLQFLVPSWAGPETPATILTAGGADEFAGPLPGGGRPAFSYLVLGGLLGWADADGDGRITASEVAAYSREALRATVRGRTQTPEIAGPDVVLARSTGARGPNLADIVIARAPAVRAPPGVPPNDPLVARLNELHRAQQARIAAERAEAELAASLEREVRERLDRDEAALIARATAAWRALAPLLATGGPEARQGAQAFVETYRDAAVTAGEQRRAVRIALVDRAVAFLEQGDASALTVKVTAPQPPPFESLPWLLFVERPVQASQRAEADPVEGWYLHQAMWHLPAQLRARCEASCADAVDQAGVLLAEIATYTTARLDASIPEARRRELYLIFIGAHLETIDLWYAATRPIAPLLATEPFDGFSQTAPAAGRAWIARAALNEAIVWTDRFAPDGKCKERSEQRLRDLVSDYDALAPHLDGGSSTANAALRRILGQGHAAARRAARCR